MLKNIPGILSPDLLKTLMEMGHGDEVIIADGNFPRLAYPENVIRLDGHGIPEILEAILKVMPLDNYVKHPVTMMSLVEGDDFEPRIWDEYKDLLSKNNYDIELSHLERFEFYEYSKKTYAVIVTSEGSLYANIILKKGVVVS